MKACILSFLKATLRNEMRYITGDLRIRRNFNCEKCQKRK